MENKHEKHDLEKELAELPEKLGQAHIDQARADGQVKALYRRLDEIQKLLNVNGRS